MVTDIPWLAADPVPDEVRRELRLQAIFDWNKWDQQIADVPTFAGFPIILRAAEWNRISRWAEALSAEALAAETEIALRPELHSALGFPPRLARALRKASGRPSAPAPRLIRFDFHYTDAGWRISEANSDVPGGLNETSGYPHLLSPHYPGARPGPDVTDCYARAVADAVKPGATVALVYATAYADDHQVMEFVARRFATQGLHPVLLAPSQIAWRNGAAFLQSAGGGRAIDLIVRFYPAEWLPNLPDSCGWQNFFGGNHTPVSNPASAILSQTKRFPLIWDQLRTALPAWRELLPRSEDPRRVPWRSDARWLVKPALGRVGEDVGMREVLKPRAWKQIAASARWSPRGWVAQERFASRTLENAAGSWFPCIGVYTIDGKVAGAYGRCAHKPLIDQEARDVAVLIAEDDP